MTRRNIMATQLERLKEQLINAEKREKEPNFD